MLTPPWRKIQIISRLYDSKEHILNAFDIDCCCVGFDGKVVLATPRACAAISTRVNLINLNIRGKAYENRLLKYAERGFAIGVPRLRELPSLDRDHLTFVLEKDSWGLRDHESLGSKGWNKWSKSSNLERLLMAQNLGRQIGIIEKPFRGRQRNEIGRDKVPLQFKYIPVGLADTYSGGSSRGQKQWPATSQVGAFHQAGPQSVWLVKWQPGNIPRSPLTWSDWSKGALLGTKRTGLEGYFDSEAWHRSRAERERKAKEAKDMELAKVRLEATADMQKELNAMQKQIDDSLCIVCMDATKSVLLEPCRHFCLCMDCAQGVEACPVCRSPCTISKTYG